MSDKKHRGGFFYLFAAGAKKNIIFYILHILHFSIMGYIHHHLILMTTEQ